MGLLDKLKKKEKSDNRVDFTKVQSIVDRMQKKYAEQGLKSGKGSPEFTELHAAIQGKKTAHVQIQKVDELKESDNGFVRFFGKFFFALKAITQPISKALMGKGMVRRLRKDLNAANMKYSASQWMALTVAAGIAALLFGLLLGILLVVIAQLPALLSILIALALFMIALVMMLLLPKRRAKARGNAIEREVPFALRHMATELRAGIGFYRTLQTIASADYGALSEEISRTIIEIEEGTDTKEALKNLANRTYCKSLKNAVTNMVRALKTGGNLSDAMDEIAAEVSFELRTQLQTFSSKMNFMGVIFIFIAIVFPVFVSILGAIRNTPLQSGGYISFDAIPLTPDVIAVIYLLIMPIVFVGLFGYIMSIQPKM
jgi:archaeal flagellar protein FlaJ